MKVQCYLILLFSMKHISEFSIFASDIAKQFVHGFLELVRCFATYIIDEEATWLS